MSNEKQQTAVQWLVEQFTFKTIGGVYTTDGIDDVTNLVEQSKEMEKERMIDFALICVFGDTDVDPIIRRAFAEVFNETYAGKDDKQDQQI
jgi:hypothetical protein